VSDDEDGDVMGMVGDGFIVCITLVFALFGVLDNS
jgi:hypothetical protein